MRCTFHFVFSLCNFHVSFYYSHSKAKDVKTFTAKGFQNKTFYALKDSHKKQIVWKHGPS